MFGCIVAEIYFESYISVLYDTATYVNMAILYCSYLTHLKGLQCLLKQYVALLPALFPNVYFSISRAFMEYWKTIENSARFLAIFRLNDMIKILLRA